MNQDPNKDFLLSIVIPVYNEEAYIDRVLERVFAVPFQPGVRIEVIAVDDCSRDATYEHLKAWESRGVRAVRHEKNGGKGAALHTGFSLASGDAVTIQDADFEYDPQDLPRVLQPVLDGEADIVFGARDSFWAPGPLAERFHWHYVINKFLSVFSNIFSGYGLHDMECCYKLFRKEILDKITLVENRFGFEPEVTLKTSRLKPAIREVQVSYAARTYAEGKKINWKDGVSALRCILKYGLFRR